MTDVISDAVSKIEEIKVSLGTLLVAAFGIVAVFKGFSLAKRGLSEVGGGARMETCGEYRDRMHAKDKAAHPLTYRND